MTAPVARQPTARHRRPHPTGPPLFASGRDEPRARRPTDTALAITSALVVLVTGVVTTIAADLDRDLAELLARAPPFFDALWLTLVWASALWAVVLLGAAIVRRRPTLARDIVASVTVALAVAVLLGTVVGDDGWASLRRLLDVDGPPAFPPGLLTATAAAIAVASPHVTRPFRHLGRWLLAGQVVSTTLLGASIPSGSLAAIATGLFAAAAVHLVVGSPGGRPTTTRIELALRELGLDVVELAPVAMGSSGVVRSSGRDVDGPIDVKVYGRDAWDAQLLTTLWRLAWYRGSQRSARLTRIELVEHEAFTTLLAERAGVQVPRLVTAGSAGRGDALVVVRPAGRPLAVALASGDVVQDATMGLAWSELARLHAAGIAHHVIDPERVELRADGGLGFADLSSATVGATVDDRRHDRAQMLALLIAIADEPRAVASARSALGDDGLLAVLPFLQEAALPDATRDALREHDVDVDDVRDRARQALGAPEQALIRLRRVTVGSLLNLALLAVAGYTLIVLFGDVDLAAFADAVADADWWWLGFGLIVAQLARVPAAVSTTGAVQTPLPLGPLTALQFAICYVNLAIPSTAARVAINVRFFQRFGVAPATAMAAGVIDSISGFVIQIAIFLTLFVASDLDLGLSTDMSETSGVGTVALVVIIGVLVAAAVVVAVAPLRRRVVGALRQAASALRVLRSPAKLVRLFGGNLVSQVTFAVAFAVCAEAFGVDLPLSHYLLINTVVSLFAGLLPVPGGMGVTEAGLTLGLVTAGVATDTAVAVTLAYRFTSFYLPPIWGWVAYRWLIRRRYL